MTQVRDYCDNDRERLFELARENYTGIVRSETPVDSGPVTAYFEHIVSIPGSGKGRLLVAEEDGQLLGFVCLLGPVAPEQDTAGEPYAFMSDLYVREAARRHGVGKMLVERVEDLARDMGVGQLALRVAADNTGARRFYTRYHYDEKFIVMARDIKRKSPG